jgi:hypothetical protein
MFYDIEPRGRRSSQTPPAFFSEITFNFENNKICFRRAATFSITTLSIMALSIMTLSIMTQLKNKNVTLSITKIIITIKNVLLNTTLC